MVVSVPISIKKKSASTTVTSYNCEACSGIGSEVTETLYKEKTWHHHLYEVKFIERDNGKERVFKVPTISIYIVPY